MPRPRDEARSGPAVSLAGSGRRRGQTEGRRREPSRKRCGAPRCMRSRGPALHIRPACGQVAPAARSTFCAAVRPSDLVASRGRPRCAPVPGRPGRSADRIGGRRRLLRGLDVVPVARSAAVGLPNGPAVCRRRRTPPASVPRRRRGRPLRRRRRSPSGGPGAPAGCCTSRGSPCPAAATVSRCAVVGGRPPVDPVLCLVLTEVSGRLPVRRATAAVARSADGWWSACLPSLPRLPCSPSCPSRLRYPGGPPSQVAPGWLVVVLGCLASRRALAGPVARSCSVRESPPARPPSRSASRRAPRRAPRGSGRPVLRGAGVASGRPAVSLCGGVVLRRFPQAAQGVSRKFLKKIVHPQDVHRTCARRAPDVPTLSPDPCTGGPSGGQPGCSERGRGSACERPP